MENILFLNPFQSLCQYLKISNELTSKYHSQINWQVKPYNQTLTAMLRCHVSDLQLDYYPYTFTLAYLCANQVHRSTIAHSFGRVHYHSIPNITLESTVSTEYMLNAVKHRAGLQAKLLHLLNCARTS